MANEPPFTLTVDGDVHVTLRIAGPCDGAVDHELKACLDELVAGPAATVTVDLSACTLLCARCVGLLLNARSRMGDGRKLVVANAGGLIRKVLRITEADRVLTVV